MNIKISNTGIKPHLEVGEWVRDISESGNGHIYVIAKISDTSFALVCLSNGVIYDEVTSRIENVFGGDIEDFIHLENVEIIIR